MQMVRVILCIIFLTIASSCNKEDDPSRCDLPACDPGRKTISKLAGTFGTVYYNDEEKEFAIHIEVDGGIDSQNIGITCNLPVPFRKPCLKVVFSGEYKEFCKAPISKIPGATYYYLHISNVKDDI